MKWLPYLLRKEFRQIFRNTLILRMILAVPIVQLLIIPLTADYEVKNIQIAVVDQDMSGSSYQLIQQILASGYFRLSEYGHSYRQAVGDMEEDRVDMILHIPHGFDRAIVQNDDPVVFISTNGINAMKASVGGGYLQEIIQTYSNETQIHHLGLPARSSGIAIKPRYWYNTDLSYPNFMVPGILVILVTMVGGYMTALNIVKEKEAGTLEQINVSPIPKMWFIMGKLIPFWILGVVIFTIGLWGVAYTVYNIVPAGQVGLIYAFLCIYLIAILGFGLLLSTYSRTQQQAMSLAFLCMMIFVLMSGLFTPVESMPAWAQWLAYANPVTWFIDVMRLVIMKGSEWSDITTHFCVIVCFAVVFNSWAVWNYRKTG